MNYFSSDFHLLHKVITKYRPQFSSAKEHDEYILEMMSKLGKRDILHILGDFIFDAPEYESYLEAIGKMPLRIKLVLGNHDSKRLYQARPKNIELQLPLYSYKNLWISHCPIHPDEIRGRLGNVCGHLHGTAIKHFDGTDDERYFNVNLDNNDFKFVPFETIQKHFDM